MQSYRLKVGMVVSLTGQFHSQGSQALQGAAAWVQDVNTSGGVFVGSHGRTLPVWLKHYDDGSKAQSTRAFTEKLIVDDGVDLLLGPYSSNLTLAAAPVAEEYQRVLWNHGGASDQIYSRGFRWIVGILTPASRYLVGVVDLVKERDPGTHKVAIVRSSTGSFPLAVSSGVEDYAAQEGFQIVFKGQYSSPSSDFALLLNELRESEPDIILGVGRIQDDLLLARQMVVGRIRAKAIALVAAGVGEFGEALGDDARGFIGPSQWEPGGAYSPEYGPSGRDLARRFEVLRPGGGDYAMAQAYAAGLVAQRCVEQAGTLDNHALREMAKQLDFTTFYGRFKLDPVTGCQVGRSVVIVQWQGDEKVIVWPKGLRQADPIYPSHSSL